MSNPKKEYQISKDILKEYSSQAINNAHDLIRSSQLLFDNKFFARAYFLAVASIEETGKAYLAYTSIGRNINSIKAKLWNSLENHGTKISTAFLGFLVEEPNGITPREISELSVHLHEGREKSMYVDINKNNTISTPTIIVEKRQAEGSITVARICLRYTKLYFQNNEPFQATNADDKLFNMKTGKLTELFENQDFGQYLLHCLRNEKDALNFSKHITTYYDAYHCTGKKFEKDKY
jgi:AbiV family abortive infection protein